MLNLNAMSVQENGFAFDQLDAVARQLCKQVSVLRGDHDVDAVQQGRQRRIAAQLDRKRGGAALHATIPKRLFAQRLAGYGAGQQARAADLRLALDYACAKAGLGRLYRGFLTRGTGAYANQIEFSRLHYMPAKLST
jgi:hypothetical protein